MSGDGISPRSNYYLQEFLRGRISRREFMGRMFAAGLGATAVAQLISASAQAATPKKGGKITLGVEAAQAKDSLDPTKFYGTADIMRGFAVYDLLVNRGPDLLPVPWLATEWGSSDDATKWTFKLRKGVQFHNGKELTAEDVIYSMSRHIGEKSESPAKAYLSQIVEMTKDDSHTVTFNLSSPNADLPVVFSDTRVHITQDGYEDYQDNGNGTGPFKVKEYKSGSVYVLERNDNYWGDDGPFVDEIEYVGIGDPTQRINALISGDINLLLYLDPKAVSLVEKRDDTEVVTAKSGAHVNLAMMVDRAPTKDPDVRLALKHAIDRERIVKNVYKGYAHVGNDHRISPIDPFYCEDVAQRVYDPDKARFHIKKAGLENTPIDFYASDVPGPGAKDACILFQQSAKEAGINLKVIEPPADAFWTTVWIQKPLSVSGWDARPVPDLIFSIASKSDAEWNETKWKNPQFDKLLVEARGVTDFAKRKEMYCEMQRLQQDDGGCSILAFYNYLDARRSEVKGITPHPSGPIRCVNPNSPSR